MHFHERQTDLWVALNGRATVSLVDLRPVIAETSDRPVVEQFALAAGGAVLIPSRVAHGFLAAEAFELLYLVTVEYDGTDEYGFAWNDPAVGLEWPPARPILSSRDSTVGSMREAIAAARQRETVAPAM
jgi:dTDP-4-dehydrorhamnose 3,5-epimerase-like enzyme